MLHLIEKFANMESGMGESLKIWIQSGYKVVTTDRVSNNRFEESPATLKLLTASLFCLGGIHYLVYTISPSR